MPRRPRLDAPGTLHHVIARGIERRDIFWGDRDRDDFLERLAEVVLRGDARLFAWALLPNHFHLLLRTGEVPLSRLMRRLITGYAVAFNLRHDRHGHLFQNRYKSLACEEEPYLLELVRYIHLNPLRGRLVASLEELARFPYCGHGVLLCEDPPAWQEVAEVLGRFGGDRDRYVAFVAAGVERGHRPDLVGGGLQRGDGAWSDVVPVRAAHERPPHDARILGGPGFVAELLAEADGESLTRLRRRQGHPGLADLVERAAGLAGLSPDLLRSGTRRRGVVAARAALAQVAVREFGYSGAAVARALGVATSTINRHVAAEGWVPLAKRLREEMEEHCAP